MGKGDRKTAKGKRYNSSYGNARSHTVSKAAVGAAALVVPHADGRAGGVAEEADRVGVGARHQLGAAGVAAGSRQDLAAGAAGAEVRGQQVLPAVAVGQRGLQPGGDVGFARAQHVAHFLRVGAELEVAQADVGVQHVAGLDDALAAAERRRFLAGHARALEIDVGHEPHRQAEFLVAAAEFFRGGIVQRGHVLLLVTDAGPSRQCLELVEQAGRPARGNVRV